VDASTLLVLHRSNIGHILVVMDWPCIDCPADCCFASGSELEWDVHKVGVARHDGCQEAGESPMETGIGTAGTARRTKRRRMRGNSAREVQKSLNGRCKYAYTS
jgi:hypothetical protein